MSTSPVAIITGDFFFEAAMVTAWNISILKTLKDPKATFFCFAFNINSKGEK
jgi:hypothetical protein